MGPDIYSKLNFGRKWQQSGHLVEEWSSISRPTGQLCQQEASAGWSEVGGWLSGTISSFPESIDQLFWATFVLDPADR